MKKSFLFSMMAFVGMTFASCSQEEIVSTAANGQVSGPVTISVNIPQADPVSRAMPDLGTDYTRRCIMQLVDGEGAAIAETRMVQAVTSDNVSFSFTAPEGEYQCVFWADYIQVGADQTVETAPDWVYNTTALPTITYASNRDRHFTDAADAFCGVLNPANGTSTTLTRPLTRIDLGTEALDEFAGYTTIQVARFNIPGSFNVFTRTVDTATTQEIRLDAREMDDAATGDWASLYVFAPADQTEFTTSMTVTVSGEGVDNKSQTVESLTLDENMIADMNFTMKDEPGPEPGQDMNVTVSFGDDFTNQPAEPVDPNAPLAVGDYVNANGQKVATAEEAVAVVFALADAQADASSYSGIVEAYAVSLTKAAGRAYLTSEGGTWTPTLTATTATDTGSPYSGYQMSSAMMTAVGDYASRLFSAYTTWVEGNTFSNSSDWYIPSYAQLQDILALDDAALKAGLNAAYGGAYFLISSSVNDDLTIKGSTFNPETGEVTKADQAVDPATHQGMIFPVVTIFE